MAAYRRVDDLTVTCGLTACTPGSAPGPTLGIEYGKPLPFLLLLPVLGVVPGAPTTIEIILVFTFQSLESHARFWYRPISTFSCSFSSTRFSGHCSIYQECRLVVLLYDHNIWPSVFNHVVRLDTYIPENSTFSASMLIGTTVPNANAHPLLLT